MSGFQSDLPIPVNFTRQQWEHILNLLGRVPFNEVAPFIVEIQRHLQMAEMRQRSGVQGGPPRLMPEGYGPAPSVE